MEPWNDLNLRCKLGVGTWAWGDKQVWGYGKDYSDSDIRDAFESSIADGINFFDTAEMYGYGRSERLIGRYIGEKKISVVIATKFMPLPWRLRRQDLINALKKSLDRLGVKSVHLYQIHWPLHLRPLNTWMDALAEAVEKGLTRGVGVSNYSADQMKRAHDRLNSHGIPLFSNQVEYSLLHRAPDTNGVRKACADLGVKLIAYSPLAMGVLTGKYSSNHKLSGYRGFRFNRYLPDIQNLIGLLTEIGQAYGGKSPSQVALNWTICKQAFPIPGAKNAEQAKQNAGAQGWSLSENDIATIEQAAEALRG